MKGNWSEEGNVFIYSQSNPFTPETIYFQIRVDESDLPSSILVPFAPIIDGEVYQTFDTTVDRYLDLSTRGDSILAIARREPSYAEIPYLVVWTPDAATNSYRIPAVGGEDVCNASFTQNDANIAILTRDGRLLVYQIATQTIQVLSASVTLDCSFLSAFSPNGSWVAIADYATDQLGFIDIDARIAQSPDVLFPPVANAGADQTLEDSDGDGIGELTFNGLESLDIDGEIVSYVWSQGVLQQPEGSVQTMRFPVGVTTFTLTVKDNDGLIDTDDIIVVLNPPPATSVPTEYPTATATPSALATLRLTSLCSADPTKVRVWRVRNANPDPVDFTWDVVGTTQSGSGTVPGGTADTPGELTFQTTTVAGPNTTRIFVGGVQQDVKASTPDACVTPEPTPITRLRLTSMCSPDPASVRVWRVRNPNAVQVLITWQVVGTQQGSSLIVPASSDAFFETVTVPGPNTTRIFVDGVQQDVKASGTTQCTTP